VQPATDGRVQRGARNRAAIVDAVLSLLDEGDPKPSARAIAARAGVSLRSVFQHFDDLETLYTECVRRQHDRISPLLTEIDASGPLADRIDALVAQRSSVYERIAPVRRAGLLAAPTSPVLQAGLVATATRLRDQLRTLFATEFEGPGSADRLAAADLVTSFDAWEHLRATQQLPVATAGRVMTLSLRELLR
jgi:TetR/AcrR family transcriptional regulator, regulator of autoinduction and epiphytic fitness